MKKIVIASAFALLAGSVGVAIAGTGCTRSGTSGDDVVRGTNGADVLCGLGGDDRLIGRGGNDVLIGGPGDDLLTGGGGNDDLRGDAGVDIASYADADVGVRVKLRTTSAQNTGLGRDVIGGVEGVTGSPHDDVLRGSAKANVLSGGGGDDKLFGEAGGDLLTGGGGDDTLIGSEDVDTLDGNDGDDQLRGGAAVDVVDGGSGADTIDYRDAAAGVSVSLVFQNSFCIDGSDCGADDDFEGIESMIGSDFDDVLLGDGGSNTASGGEGDDDLHLDAGIDCEVDPCGDDVASGGPGDDLITGNWGNNDLFGDAGNDEIFAGPGDDFVDGGPDTDTCDAGGQPGDVELNCES